MKYISELTTKTNFRRINQCRCLSCWKNKHRETNKIVCPLLPSFIRSNAMIGVVCQASGNAVARFMKVMAEKLHCPLKF